MLELKHVGFETDDNKEILHDVSLTVQDRFVAITGPNGGGKSTLAKVIAGIYQPTSGQIFFKGQDITDKKLDIAQFRRQIGMVFQNFNVFPHLTVLENITLAPTLELKIPRE